MEKIFQKAWENYKKNIVTFIGGYFLSLLIPVIIISVPAVVMFLPLLNILLSSGINGAINYIFANFRMLLLELMCLFILSFFIFPPFTFGFIHLVKEGRKRKGAKIKMLFDGIKVYWKKAIVQQILSLLIFLGITVAVGIPALSELHQLHIHTSSFSTIISNKAEGIRIIGLILGYLFLWLALLLIVGFFLIYWRYEIVNFNTGVLEGLKRSVKKVRYNLLETFVVWLVIIMISSVTGLLDKIIPFVATFILAPLIISILVEASLQLKEKK